jgi:ubiquinone/menaquinone biosynthesis C-methylase UbiE
MCVLKEKNFRYNLDLFKLKGERIMYKFKNSEVCIYPGAEKIRERSYRGSALALSVLSLLAFNPVGAMDATEEQIKNEVKSSYGAIAQSGKPCFSCSPGGCGETPNKPSAQDYALNLGYSAQDMQESPIGADLGLGCGNPTAIASLREGEVVIDLGSGGGFDCFLASKKVGPTGKVIGVDMTPAMLELANKNALKGNYTNVEFMFGEIEKLPLSDSIADVIISNCVVNLSTNKEAVFKEAARVLKVGGRLAISDIVTTTELPDIIKQDINLYTGCITGATKVDSLKLIMESAGFGDIKIDIKEESRSFISKWAPESKAEDYIAAAYIYATKL